MLRPQDSWFFEVSDAFRWGPADAIAMLWAYFDESGEHDKATGALTRLTLGGAIATEDNWKRLTVQWDAILKEFGVNCFHMTDFEADAGEFEGWKTDRPEDRKELLGLLLGLIETYAPILVGYSNEPWQQDGSFKLTYGKGVVDAVVSAARDLAPQYSLPVSMVFAKHPEFSFSRIEQIFGAGVIDYGSSRLGTCAVDDPCRLPALQAADIVAYELSRVQRADRPERYPLTYLKQRVISITLTHRNPSATSAWER